MNFERPKTSRGHRNPAEELYIKEEEAVKVTQMDQPIIRKSNKKSIFSNAQTMNSNDRPSTGMGFYEPPSTPNYQPSTPVEKSPTRQQIERPSSGYFVSPRNERPKTGYGRRSSDAHGKMLNDTDAQRPFTPTNRR